MRKPRFPTLKKVDGVIVCRCGCGKPIPKGRQTWASKECLHRYHPTFVMIAVRKRDQGICQICKLDIRAVLRQWQKEEPIEPRFGEPSDLRISWWARRQKWLSEKPDVREEYDHIIPFSEGGETVLENIRTLCRPCHVAVTAKWRREKAAKKKASQKKSQEFLFIDTLPGVNAKGFRE